MSTWSHEKPTKEGFYWMQRESEHCPRLVFFNATLGSLLHVDICREFPEQERPEDWWYSEEVKVPDFVPSFVSELKFGDKVEVRKPGSCVEWTPVIYLNRTNGMFWFIDMNRDLFTVTNPVNIREAK